jgi:hypothetical protein
MPKHSSPQLLPTGGDHVGYHHTFIRVIAVVNGTSDETLLTHPTSRQYLRYGVLADDAYAFFITPFAPDIKASAIFAKDTRALVSRSCGVCLVGVIDARSGNGDERKILHELSLSVSTRE